MISNTLFLNTLFCAALIPLVLPTRAAPLSTTPDGGFQAIAHGSSSISLYYKGAESSPAVSVDGVPQSGLQWRADPVTGYSVATLCNLRPNTRYTFSLGEDGASVSECTWSEIPAECRYDLLVIGGNASGLAAAVSAARLGMRVALVEQTNRLGGMASNGLGSTDMVKMDRSNGFFEDFRRRIIDYYGSGDGRFYEPRVANAIFKEMAYEQPNITRFLGAEAACPLMSGNRVTGAVVRDMASARTGRLLASVTIDATVTADFAAAAGVRFCTGREARTSAEPHAGFIYFDNAKQEILPGSTGAGDRLQQSYAYLMVWKDYGEAGAPMIEKPRYYDPETYRYSPEWDKTWNNLYGRLPNGKFEINQHPFGIDWPGINHDYPTASRARRIEIEAMYRDRALGYLYFMQNERGHKNLGLADDEFVDNANFPRDLYVREARRMVGRRIFRENDVTCARDIFRADAIAIGDYPMDSHAMEDLKDPNRLDKGEGEQWLKKFTPWYQAPMYVIVPDGIEGLLVTTAVSASHVGYGTLRMEPVRMSLGQAAAALAYWGIGGPISMRDINPAWVQDKLLSQGSYIYWNSDVNRDTRHFPAIQFLTARGMFPTEAFEPESALTNQDALAAINKLLALEGCAQPLSVELSSPGEPVTRGQFALWLVQAKQRTSRDWGRGAPSCQTYTDVPPGSPYFAAVEEMAGHRIRAGLFADAEPGLFKPDASLTRADAAEAIYLAHREYAMRLR